MSSHRHWTLLLVSLFLMTGCAASGVKFTDYSQGMNGTQAVRTLYFFRAGQSLYASGSVARIFVNGEQKGSCKHRGFTPVQVPEGIHMVYVDTWDLPGQCWAAADMTNSTRAYFELDPKGSVGVAGVFGGYLGAAAAAAGQSCGGLFTVTPTPEAVALEKMKDLRQSN